MKSFIKVKNLNGTTDNKPPKGSWKIWWEEQTHNKFSRCSCKTCDNNAEVGAHVQKAESADRKWYIVPLCIECNVTKKNELFEVEKDKLVPVNQ